MLAPSVDTEPLRAALMRRALRSSASAESLPPPEVHRDELGQLLMYVQTAVGMGRPEILGGFIEWLRSARASRGLGDASVAADLGHMLDTLAEVGGRDARWTELVADARSALSVGAAAPRMGIRAEQPHAEVATAYLEALLAGDRSGALAMVEAALERGVPVQEVYLHVFQATQYEIGSLWEKNRISVAQEHYCTAATQYIMSRLYPHVLSDGRAGRTLIATCVSGDLHEIGIRMVADFFEMAGWRTIYLGASTPHDAVAKTARDHGAHALAISATIGAHVQQVADLIRAVRASNPSICVLVGGHPFNADPSLWQAVGADGHATDAQEALRVAGKLLAR